MTEIDSQLINAALAWADDDPDPATSDQLRSLVDAARGGDDTAAAELTDVMAGPLQFGTAGLRGELGPGPNRMNRSVVIRAAAGLMSYLKASKPEPFVVVGYDARTNSDVFARDTCAVVLGAGGGAAVLPHPLPTPVLAYAIEYLGADAAVMVTASHNPARDNGYKVYLGGGSQIVPPVDAEIAAEIARVASAAVVPRRQGGWDTVADDVIDAYVADAASVAAPGPRDLQIAYSAMHGVGSQVMRGVFETAGFPALVEVAAQAEPDPAFPTVDFPNPEEPGAMDALLEAAAAAGADLAIANDPDADRCAAAIATDAGYRVLRGDEIGVLLGSAIIERGPGDGAVLANSIVSSRQLAAMAAAAGLDHVETLTGFKWIARVPGLVYGYEEALGYCVDPARVRDKDGITAALALADLAAREKANGRTLADRLDDLARAHGVYATDAYSIRVDTPAQSGAVLDRLLTARPPATAGLAVTTFEDLGGGPGGLPPTPGVRWYLADDSRIIVRPSGTEPKLKVYLEVLVPVTTDLQAARTDAATRLAALRADVSTLTTLPG